MWQSFVFIFRRLKNNFTCLFYKQHFHEHYQAEIWSKVITVSSIKRNQKKNERLKWKTCWVKSITTTRVIHYYWKVLLTPSFSRQAPYMDKSPNYKLVILPFLEQSSPFYHTAPSLFMGKFWPPLFRDNFENPLCRARGRTMWTLLTIVGVFPASSFQ